MGLMAAEPQQKSAESPEFLLKKKNPACTEQHIHTASQKITIIFISK